MAILYVRDKDTREIIKLVENFVSLVWTERYQEAGEFVLDMPVTKENIDLFRRGRYISFDESEETMIIQTVNITESYGDEKEPLLEISGKSLATILSRRVNASKVVDFQKQHIGTISYSGSFSSVCQSIVNDDLINPIMYSWSWYHWDDDNNGYVHGVDMTVSKSKHKVDIDGPENVPSRKIDHTVFKNLISAENDPTVDVEYTKLMTLYDLIVKLCRRYIMGVRVVINADNNFEIQVYSGTDRTTKQKTLEPVIFNPIMDNISYVNYYEDDTEYKNYWFTYIDGYIAPKEIDWNNGSSGIYQGRTWGMITDKNSSTYTGVDRYEIPLFSDAVSSTDDFDPNKTWTSGDGTENPAPEHWPILLQLIADKVRADGKTQFEDGEYEILTTSEGAIDPLVRYHYGEDYFIGDRVNITNANGVVMTGIINEVVKSYDSDGIILTPNFMNMTEYDYGEEEETL